MLPEQLKSIGKWAFLSCTNIKDIVFPKSLKCIEENAFKNCDGTVSVTGISNPETANKLIVPSKHEELMVSGIGEGACSGCSQLVYVQLPEGLQKIGSNAFSRCGSLGSIVIPDTVTSIGSRAFYGNGNLKNVIFEEADMNDICKYAERFPISAFIGTKYLYSQFEMP